MKQKLLAIVLAAAMVIMLLPVVALADDPEYHGSVFDGLIGRLFGLIRFKKIGDDIKAISILKIILDFITRIFEIFTKK